MCSFWRSFLACEEEIREEEKTACSGHFHPDVQRTQKHPEGRPTTRLLGRMAKKDMSFMKMVSNDEDFHREVYDHGQENLLVSAPPPPASLVCACLC